MPFACTTVRIVGPTGRGARGTMAYDVLAGVKVVEVAAWLFAPSCGAILADWGADVLKIETPHHGGDPYRGYFHPGPVNPTIELANRGKRSVALDGRVRDQFASGCSSSTATRGTTSPRSRTRAR